MSTDGSSPDRLSRLPIEGDDLAHLPRAYDDVLLHPGNINGREYRRDLEVVVEQVMWSHLVVPKQLAVLGIQRNYAARVEVVSRPARPVRELLGPRPRPRVPYSPIHDACSRIDCRRIPGAPAAVHLRVTPDVLRIDRVEAPYDFPGVLIQGVDHTERTALVEVLIRHARYR